jgi:hypothetical protein
LQTRLAIGGLVMIVVVVRIGAMIMIADANPHEGYCRTVAKAVKAKLCTIGCTMDILAARKALIYWLFLCA